MRSTRPDYTPPHFTQDQGTREESSLTLFSIQISFLSLAIGAIALFGGILLPGLVETQPREN
ncbi:hypothetical protein QC761_0041870 [Podospora bellae-mahoneyi]|uniref:Uncharacterized protein n=1 Tax=Podospora bellae-mahoneyi TaxID=2093777 RepID=A0ABR0FSB3_9PEZI|nr:hypothetical protein QC761_0041870 [Podospora bellae-mahoneyi]